MGNSFYWIGGNILILFSGHRLSLNDCLNMRLNLNIILIIVFDGKIVDVMDA